MTPKTIEPTTVFAISIDIVSIAGEVATGRQWLARLEACKAADEYINHSPGCNVHFYGRDRVCNCGFPEYKKQLRAAIQAEPDSEQGHDS